MLLQFEVKCHFVHSCSTTMKSVVSTQMPNSRSFVLKKSSHVTLVNCGLMGEFGPKKLNLQKSLKLNHFCYLHTTFSNKNDQFQQPLYRCNVLGPNWSHYLLPTHPDPPQHTEPHTHTHTCILLPLSPNHIILKLFECPEFKNTKKNTKCPEILILTKIVPKLITTWLSQLIQFIIVKFKLYNFVTFYNFSSIKNGFNFFHLYHILLICLLKKLKIAGNKIYHHL